MTFSFNKKMCTHSSLSRGESRIPALFYVFCRDASHECSAMQINMYDGRCR
jgi:hypothetical protein